jgi:cytochrome c oxidase subunit 3
MTPARTLDVSTLPHYEISSVAPLWWGQLLLCIIEGSMFCMLIAIYFYIRLSVDVWPPPRIEPFHQTLPAVALIPLIGSVIGSYRATEGARRDSRPLMLGGLIINLILASIFLAVRFVEWRTFNFAWASGGYGTIVWSILFVHTFDVVADLIMTAVLIVLLAIGRSGPRQRLGVHVDSVVWYFLAGAWLPLYILIYWGPHIVSGQ